MKTSFKRYLYIFSIVIPVVLLCNLIFIFSVVYDGGVKEFDELNKTLPFISTKVKVSELFLEIQSTFSEEFSNLSWRMRQNVIEKFQ